MVRESLCQHGIPELFDFERKDSLRQRCYSLRTGNDGEPLVLEVRQRVKGIFETIFLSPIVIPTIISAVAFLQYFAIFGNMFTNYWKLCLTYAIIEIPYVIRTVTANLVGLDTGFEEASLVLGASPVRTLFKVTLPCIR